MGCRTDAGEPWELTKDDLEAWETLLTDTRNWAVDFGVDSFTVLEVVAQSILHNVTNNTTKTSMRAAPRIADILLAHVDSAEQEVPEAISALVNDTLVRSYPPDPLNKVESMWLLRTLTKVVEDYPDEHFLALLGVVSEGLCMWVGDACGACSLQEYSYDVS